MRKSMRWAAGAMVLAALFCACRRAPAPELPVKVKAVRVSAGGDPEGLYYSGTIEAAKDVSLSFLTIGTVAEVSVREGDRVKKGQLLAKLDCQSNESLLQIAAAKARQAVDAFKRFEPMYKNGNLAEIKMVDIQTARTLAEQTVKLAEKNVSDCSIIAPQDGLISDRSLEPGDSAIPGKSVLRLVSMDSVYASIAVPEQEIGAIRRGGDAVVELSGLSKARLHGRIADVGVSANPLARTYTVRINVENRSSSLLPGMLCNVYLSGKTPLGKGLLIPATALKLDGNGSQFVYVINAQSKRVRRQIVLASGFRQGGVLISGGLDGSEIIVSEGAQKLDDNAQVEADL